MPDIDQKTIEAIVRLAREAATIQTTPDGMPFIVAPAGSQLLSLEKLIYHDHRATPERKRGDISVFDSASFLKYWDDFGDENSQIFADEDNDTILGILDYHAKHADGSPRWGQHRLTWKLESSAEWDTWNTSSGTKFTQADFADFIETNTPDIIKPNGATMLECARDLRAKVDVDFASAQRQANGSIALRYSEKVTGTYGSGDVEVPEEFTISIPVYIGGDRISLTARLRYRINAGRLVFWYDLLRADQAEADAFRKVRQEIADARGIVILSGRPG